MGNLRRTTIFAVVIKPPRGRLSQRRGPLVKLLWADLFQFDTAPTTLLCTVNQSASLFYFKQYFISSKTQQNTTTEQKHLILMSNHAQCYR